jgi:pantetheine-phosphate adenylyltransferase
MAKLKAVYAGSFDPVTYGHLNILESALKLFDEVYVAVARNIGKTPTFNPDERVKLIHQSVKSNKRIHVESFEGLAVDYARQKKAVAMIRGMRALSDFDAEFQMALANRRLDAKIETIFLMPHEDLFFISSRLIKEIASFGGHLKDFVPPHVERALKEKLSN